MTDINLSPTGPPETVLNPEPDDALEALRAALAQPIEGRRDAVADVCARWPRFLDAWAQLGRLGRDDVESYAYFRVGYHRGLDRLRPRPRFGHGVAVQVGDLQLLGCYHPSQQNTFTGKLTEAMLDEVFARARELAA